MARKRMSIDRDGRVIRLSYGFSPLLGFFVTILEPGRKVEYDALDDAYRGLPGLLDTLVREKLFAREQVEEALESLLVVDSPEDIDDEAVRQVAVMVVDLKQAAAD